MLTLIRAEFMKLRTVRSPWLVLGAAPLLVATGVAGLVISSNNSPGQKLQSDMMAHVGLVSILTLVFGILAVAGEYRHKTVTDTYLSTPGRAPAVAAKLGVYTVIGALTGAVSVAAGVLSGAAWWAAKDASFVWRDAGMWTTAGGGIAWNAAFAAIGVGLGALVRNLVGAIALALAWIAVVEGIVGQIIGGLARWLPFSAGRALGVSATNTSSDLLPRWGGGVVLAAYAVAFVVAAITTTTRRDVV
jgi:ABC-2 type transport system permease protein